MGQQPGAGAATGNRVIGCRRRHHGVAGPARQFLADMPDHFEAAGHVIEGLGDVLADPAQRAAARGAGARGGMPRVLARQVVRQRPTGRLLRLGRALDRSAHDRQGTGNPLGLVLFQGLDCQLELLGFARQFLRGAAVFGPLISRQLEFQPGDLDLRGQRILRHRGDDPLQRLRLVRQLIRGDRHSGIESNP